MGWQPSPPAAHVLLAELLAERFGEQVGIVAEAFASPNPPIMFRPRETPEAFSRRINAGDSDLDRVRRRKVLDSISATGCRPVPPIVVYENTA